MCEKIKIAHVATVDTGGAYKAVERLQKCMRLHGLHSHILVRNSVQDRTGVTVYCNTPYKRLFSQIRNFINLFWAKGGISRDLLGSDITGNYLIKEADIIILHWINSFLSYRSIEKLLLSGKRIIFVMHDMWLFTGGCHCNVLREDYCYRYKDGCGRCPLIQKEEYDISYKNYKDKAELFENKKFIVTGPSKWVVDCARNSKILNGKEIIHIPNCFDDNVFYPQDAKEELRKKWNIKTNKTVLLFGTSYGADENENKGIRYLLKALQMLSGEEYLLVIFGESKEDYFKELKQECRRIGYIPDEKSMSEVYNLADVFISPSKQETFGFTVCESMACGTPVVAFPVGGVKEQITHKQNGYLAKLFDAEDIAKGIEYCSEHKERLGSNAAEAAKKYTLENVGKKWKQLICELTELQ